jgi:hypothetical protein
LAANADWVWAAGLPVAQLPAFRALHVDEALKRAVKAGVAGIHPKPLLARCEAILDVLHRLVLVGPGFD